MSIKKNKYQGTNVPKQPTIPPMPKKRRYIDADKLIDDIKSTELPVIARSVLTECVIPNYPTADVRENVRGAWIKGEYYSNGYKEEWVFPYCSICHYETDKMYNFCPNCGADMRGKQ